MQGMSKCSLDNFLTDCIAFVPGAPITQNILSTMIRHAENSVISSYTIAGKFIEFILQEVMIKLRVATFQL